MHDILSKIDHAVLQPTHNDVDVEEACRLGLRWGIASVCVKPSHVSLAASLLADSPVAVGTVIGFPHGGTSLETKLAETLTACRQGAKEVDIVVNLGKVFSEDWGYVEAEISEVVSTAREQEALTKVIFETGLIPHQVWKVRLCELSERAGAHFVKTSTGFGYIKDPMGQLIATGATEEDVKLLVDHVSTRVGVKASGGIRSYAEAARMVELGATRIGTSATAAIAEGVMAKSDY